MVFYCPFCTNLTAEYTLDCYAHDGERYCSKCSSPGHDSQMLYIGSMGLPLQNEAYIRLNAIKR
jgi:hypothetical protein